MNSQPAPSNNQQAQQQVNQQAATQQTQTQTRTQASGARQTAATQGQAQAQQAQSGNYNHSQAASQGRLASARPQSQSRRQPRSQSGLDTSLSKSGILQKLLNLKFALPLLLLVAGFLLYRWFFTPATITVVGTGSYDFEANQVSFIATNVNRATDPAEAIQTGQAEISDLEGTVQAITNDAKIKRAFYQIDPVNTESGPAYQVVNAFSVETGQVDKINNLVQTLYANGATTVTNINFSHTEQEEMAQKAREAAVKNARAEAKRIAKSAGKRLGKMVTITDDQRQASSTVGSASQGGQGGEAGGDGKDGSQTGSFKKVSIDKQVSIVYRIW
jgi:uncharacterized protein YggE